MKFERIPGETIGELRTRLLGYIEKGFAVREAPLTNVPPESGGLFVYQDAGDPEQRRLLLEGLVDALCHAAGRERVELCDHAPLDRVPPPLEHRQAWRRPTTPPAGGGL